MEEGKGRVRKVMGVYGVVVVVGAIGLFYTTLPEEWNRMPIERMAAARKEIQQMTYFEWRALTEEEGRQAERQRDFVEGVHVVFTVCDGRARGGGGKGEPPGWSFEETERELGQNFPGSVRHEFTGQTISCGGGDADGPGSGAGGSSFIWRDGATRRDLEQAEDLSLELSARAKVVHYVARLADGPGGSAEPNTTFLNVEGFGGVCAPPPPRAGGRGVEAKAKEECLGLFSKHLRMVLYGGKRDVPLYVLKKDFDYLQRLVLLRGIASNLKSLEEYASGHFFAPIQREALELLKPSLKTSNLFKGGADKISSAYLDTSRSLFHPSLVGTGTTTIPDLHRLLLMCPYFLPVISIVLRSLASSLF
ncbi:hypothetical protein HOP50_03g27260 [Chloropicon primus]|uniref:Uncharacterized protein n=2 Tax=Chloropicon primus TaxID=1764295 RepID=A0A5B8MHV0_9CHLO|nr:hypothetical protein A3770_03p27260 [Chloropicon primus]UPQ99418.1 hypothetical protein HOP50_03g27260 [Chloropicon primus]|eukprot:QDZ20208.1 hypothetical protein A3770_03p27260 [Chloropicon primus]